MSFLKLVKLLARVALIFGVLRLLVGFYVASIADPVVRANATARYLGSGTSGEQIDKTIYVILIAGAFLLLARIASKERK
jgi:hypothetical protein